MEAPVYLGLTTHKLLVLRLQVSHVSEVCEYLLGLLLLSVNSLVFPMQIYPAFVHLD